MAQKTVKKTAAKAAVKPVAKKAAAKKTATKKTVKPATVKETKIAVAAVQTHDCGCGQNCACAGHCGCHCGSKFGRFVKKLIIFLIIFALGFAAAKLCCGGKPGMMRGPRAHFVNGCLDSTSVKCPKLLEALPDMDVNQDGCITRNEYNAFKKQMRREIRETHVEVVDAE